MKVAPDLEASLRPIGDLVLLPGNPRRGDVEAVAESLRRFGQRKPIVVNEDDIIIAGNHTYQAAVLLGWTEMAVVDISDLTPTEQAAYALADNKLSDLAHYDPVALRDAVDAVHLQDAVLLEAAGFTDKDLRENILLGASPAHENVLYGSTVGAARRGPVGQPSTVLRFDRPTRSPWHPSTKPTPLIAQCINWTTLPGDLVVDPFAGAGSTLLACEDEGRRA